MGAKFKTFGHKEWVAATNSRRFQAVLSKHMRRATAMNGMVAVRRQREVIRGTESIAANAALTIHIKGSSKPLVDHGDLFKAITFEVVDDYRVFVGVLRTNEEAFNLAVALHEGAAIQVTPAMRGMFFFLWKASIGDIPGEALTGRAAELYQRRPGGWLPLKASTAVITIPPRPWATVAFNDPNFQQQIKSNWERAAVAAFNEMAGKAGGGRPSAVSKAAKKMARAGKRLGSAAGKGLKAGKKAATKGLRAGKKVAKKAIRTGKKAANRAAKSVKRTTNKAKRVVVKTAKAAVRRVRGSSTKRKKSK